MSKSSNIALVVGGSRGIGRACVLRLAKTGFDIVLTYVSNHSAAEEVKALVEELGQSCELMAFDISDREQSKSMLEARFEETPPAVLVYNAGIARDNLFVWMTGSEWDDVMRTNLDGFYNVVQPLVFPMLRAKSGRIIVISSISGEVGQAGQGNYSASKAGLIGAAKSLAREIGKKKVLVNVVSPGLIDTEMTADLPKKQILPMIPLNRFGSSEEVAAVVNFLAAEEHMYIHGQVISVNGGMAT